MSDLMNQNAFVVADYTTVSAQIYMLSVLLNSWHVMKQVAKVKGQHWSHPGIKFKNISKLLFNNGIL